MLGVRPVRGCRFGRTPVSGGLWKLLLRMAARSFEQHQRAWLSSMRRDHMLTESCVSLRELRLTRRKLVNLSS